MGLLIHHSNKAPLAQQPTVLRGLRVPSSNYGDVVPIVFGQGRVPGKLLDYEDFTPIANTSTTAVGGKGLGGSQHQQKTTTYTYKSAVAILLCRGQIQGLYNVWDTKGKLAQQSVTENYTVPTGGGTYTVGNSANYYDDYGVGRSDPYSVNANDYGDIPRTYSGTYRTRMSPVPSAPAAGQYSRPTPGQYQFAAGDAGKTVSITYTYTVTDSSSNGQATQILSLTLFTGAAGQSPWSYLTTNHPGHDLGYSNLAYVASSSMDLGGSGSLPNYTYEVIGLKPFGAGITDANPSDIVNAILTDALIGINFPSGNIASLTQYSNYCIANGLFISPVLNSQRPASQILQEILDATNSNAYWSEGLLKIVPYGDTTVVGNGATYTPATQPLYDFTDDDFLAAADADPILITRDPWQDAYNSVQIEWCNRSNSYNPEVMEEKDDGAIATYGHRPKGSVQYDFITTSAVAQFVANTQLKREVYIRKTYTFTVPWRYCLVEPMDLVTLTDSRLGLSKTPVRVTEVDEDADGNIKITAEEFPWGTATATVYAKQAPSSYNPQADADPGQVNAPIVYEPTARATGYDGYEIWLAVSGASANWGGCYIYASRDNASFQRFGQINGPARMGVLSTTLPNTADPDTTDTVGVDLTQSFGTLTGGSQADADNFVTLCLVDNELISYQAATLTATNKYNLGTRLRRGVYGSAVASHAIGAKFVRLDEAIFKFSYDPTWIGQTIYFKFVSFNTLGGKLQGLANVATYSYTISGIKGAVDAATGVYLPGLDSIPDGTTYGKTVNTYLNANRPVVNFSDSFHANKNIDNIADGSTYARTTPNQRDGGGRAFTAIDSGNVVVASGVDLSRNYTGKHLGNIPDDASSGRLAKRVHRVAAGNASSAWYKLGTWVFTNDGSGHSIHIEMVSGNGYNTSSNQQTLTDIVIRSSNGSSGAPNLSGCTWISQGNANAVLAVKVVATGGSTSQTNGSWDVWAQIGSFGDYSLHIDLEPNDTWTNIGTSGTDPGAASSTVLVGAGQNLLDTNANLQGGVGINGKSLNIGTVHDRVSSTISSSSGTGIDNVADGVTYLRMPGSNMDTNRRGLIDFSQGGHLGKSLDNVPNGTRAAWDSTTQKSAAVDSNGNLLLKNVSQVNGTTSGPSYTSTTMATMPEMTMTKTTKGNPVLLMFFGSLYAISGGGTVAFFIDGTQVGPTLSVTGNYSDTKFSWLAQPSSASHTFEVRWAGDGTNSINCSLTTRSFQLVELG